MSNEAASLSSADPDALLSKSQLLTREEVLKRRHRRLGQLSRVYRDHYWALMEDLKFKYREYYWKYGKSPYKEDHREKDINNNSNLNNGNDGVGAEERVGENGGGSFDVNRCAAAGCKSKAMAVTRFCHLHILFDAKQKLYKGCTFAIRSSSTGSVLCGRPVLRSAVPSLCVNHLLKSEKQVTKALKRAGLNSSSATKVAPKMHVLIAEFVRQIQSRRTALKETTVSSSHEDLGTDAQVINEGSASVRPG